MNEKTCPSCQMTKPLSDYGSNTSNKGGLQRLCKSCCSESSRRRRAQYRQENLAAREAANGPTEQATEKTA